MPRPTSQPRPPAASDEVRLPAAGETSPTQQAAARSVRRDTRRLGLQLVVLLALALAVPFTVATDPFTRGVAQMICINGVLAVSFQILFGQAGVISFGHAAMYGLGAYGSAIGIVRFGLPTALAWVLSLLAVVGVAVLIGRVILRLGLLFLAVATLALGEATVLLAAQVTVTGGEEGMAVPAVFSAGAAQSLIDYGLAVTIFLLVLAVALALPTTRYGRELRAIGDDAVAALSAGIPVARRRIQVFAMSSAMAGAAGIAYAHTARFIAPGVFNLNTGILVLAMVAIGGLHSVWGAVAGAVLLTLLPEVAAPLLRLSILIYGFVLVVIFRFGTEGLAGIGANLLRAVRSRRERDDAPRSESRDNA